VIARFVYELRGSSAVDQRSGVSARFALAAAESAAASALRRATLCHEDGGQDPDDRGRATARVGDLPGVVPTLRGKVEFESGEEGREDEVLEHLLRIAVVDTFRDRLAGVDLSAFTEHFAEGEVLESGPLVSSER